MTGGAGMTGSVKMEVRTGVVPEWCRSGARERQFSPGNANLRIGTQADHEKDRHLNLSRSNVPGHTSSISPTHSAVISPHRRYVHLPASFLRRQES